VGTYLILGRMMLDFTICHKTLAQIPMQTPKDSGFRGFQSHKRISGLIQISTVGWALPPPVSLDEFTPCAFFARITSPPVKCTEATAGARLDGVYGGALRPVPWEPAARPSAGRGARAR
jgi:hypothetical protein